ncbi:lipoyl synthase [Thermomicrobium sp.]|jgi:lipoic acid synthetase|uniref:lipoyl synthase n=1 Tax=Thermomicrobium sp. TaxID=1969469 RepID=UPI001B0E5DDB|nr:lipoyl synthase [Thermomicrobium sp.]MBO9306022.1 lipoyl synthase [Thermomicrobium sp.]MBO9358861.1 lipoyl synthase [Thermomicrobium sp.]MBO9386297.1 lipoyl synthase [Thermomicrobium sp.]MBO9404265.1 lipoyl synthase [Thermomicrobium sp.]
MPSVRQPILLQKKPDWFRVRREHGPNYLELRRLVLEEGLHTVCQEARCPNIYECWNQRTATFMILGDRCTRACRFCNVRWGRSGTVDWEEPRRVAEAVERLGLDFAVITSVNRDDLPDGGAAVFAATIREIRSRIPSCGIEVLIPDFLGNWDALRTVVEARPEVIAHNIETVPRLFRVIQPWDDYGRSLELFRRVQAMDDAIALKSGLIVGMGETWDELLAVMRDLREVGVEILTIGQYLPPTPRHFPLHRYYTLEEFEELRRIGEEELGYVYVESGPLVRSSYHAKEQYERYRARRLEVRRG